MVVGLAKLLYNHKLSRQMVVVYMTVELQTKVREDFIIMKKAPTRAFSWLKAAFTFKTLFLHYL